MIKINIESDPEQCRIFWENLIPSEKITDLWSTRVCFHNHFERTLFFVVAKEGDNVTGFIPLCFIEDCGYYGYFPGEIWDGKTWLEQNRIIARDQQVLNKMICWLKEQNIRYHLRYLINNDNSVNNSMVEDEIGYLFFPHAYNYSVEQYYSTFNRRSIKSIRKEVDRLYDQGVEIRIDQLDDFNEMIKLNIERFGSQSYFANKRFANSFKELKEYLQQQGWLKMTSVIIDNQIAAVDMGCIYKGDYTLLAGGTCANFRGVAKLINLHHIQEACKNRYQSVDFLCGDFTWKKIFRLTPRPLFKMASQVGSFNNV